MGEVLTSGIMARKMYFETERPSGFSNLKQLDAAAQDSKIGKTAGELRAWFEAQDAFTLHRPVRKRIPSNLYNTNIIMDVCESYLVDVQGLSNYNDGIIHLLIVIDVFSKYLHVVPLKSTMGPALTLAFQSLLKDRK